MTEISPEHEAQSHLLLENNCHLANSLSLVTDLSLVHLNLREVAQLARTNLRTIEVLHQAGKGPPSIKIGHRTLRFRASDVLNWLEERSSILK